MESVDELKDEEPVDVIRPSLSLTAKLSLLLLGLALISVAAHAAVQRFVILPRFQQIERAEAVNDLERCLATIDRELEHLDSLCEKWGHSDAAYRFVETSDTTFVRTNLTPQSFRDAALDLICVVAVDGDVLWGEARDHRDGAPIEHPAGALETLGPEHPIRRLIESEAVSSGLVVTELGPLLVATRPILRSDLSGDPAAHLVMGRRLDEDAFAAVARQTGLEIHAWPVEKGFIDSGVPAEASVALLASRLGRGFDAEVVFDEVDAGTLHVYGTVPDVDGAAAAIVRLNKERTLLAEAKAAIGVTNVFMIAASLCVPGLLWFLLHRAVVGPISSLTRNVVRIGLDGDVSRRIRIRKADELGTLAVEFNSMLGQLERVQGHLRHAAQHDPLTGLPNRSAILDLLERHVDDETGRTVRPFALLYVDIDGFKPVNDTHGHDAGDALLVAIAERLRSNTRSADRAGGDGGYTAARLGGDEFLVLLDGTSDLSVARAVAERLERELSLPYKIGSKEIRIGASIGASVREHETETAEAVLGRADAAMYRAKARRRNA